MARFSLCRWLGRLVATCERTTRPAFRPALELLEDRLTPSVTFAPPQTFAVGNNPEAVATLDFNGDGKPDYVVANFNGGGPGAVSLLLNTTAAGATVPSFAPQYTVGVGNGPFAVAVGDFNGDNLPDLAVANYRDGTVSVLLGATIAGTTDRIFAPAVTFAVGLSPEAVAVGDFNGDGKPDLAVVNYSDGTVSVLLNPTTAGATVPSFAPQRTFAVGGGPNSVAVGDFNGDGRPDLAVANSIDDTVSVLLDATTAGATVPSFAPQHTLAVGSSPVSVAVGDCNGDNKPDLAVANYGDGTVSVLLNTTTAGAAVPSFAPQQAIAVGAGPLSLAVGDFNGDGRPDLAVGNNDYSGGTVSVLLDTTTAGATTLSFVPQQVAFLGNVDPQSLAAADFNGDGKPDLVTVNYPSSAAGTSVLLNTTFPVVTAQFGSQGVWQFNRARNAWVPLTPANATLLGDDSQGDVVGEFPHYGLWEYKPGGGWTQVNGTDVTALAMDEQGDFAVTFPGYGVYEYRAGTPKQLNAMGAYALALDGLDDVFADFRGYGLYRFHAGLAPVLLNGVDVSLLSANAFGELVVDFPGYGVATYTPKTGWQTLTTHQAQALAIDNYGDAAGSFQGSGGGPPSNTTFPGAGAGVHYPVGGWASVTPAVASEVAIGFGGDLFAEFPGYGVWEFDPLQGWIQLPLPGAGDATLLEVA